MLHNCRVRLPPPFAAATPAYALPELPCCCQGWSVSPSITQNTCCAACLAFLVLSLRAHALLLPCCRRACSCRRSGSNPTVHASQNLPGRHPAVMGLLGAGAQDGGGWRPHHGAAYHPQAVRAGRGKGCRKPPAARHCMPLCHACWELPRGRVVGAVGCTDGGRGLRVWVGFVGVQRRGSSPWHLPGGCSSRAAGRRCPRSRGTPPSQLPLCLSLPVPPGRTMCVSFSRCSWRSARHRCCAARRRGRCSPRRQAARGCGGA